MSPSLHFRIWLALALAISLQGITGWSAFMIAYSTPTIGIGCRSLIYLIYNVLSTTCCVLFLVASSCSDRFSYQVDKYNNRNDDGVRNHEPQKQDQEPSRRLAFWASAFLLSGKILAVLNTIMIVTSCIIQFLGFIRIVCVKVVISDWGQRHVF